jgi:single-strand DNA-binding protein
MAYAKVILEGNVTRDPELRSLQNGTKVAKVGLAINNRKKNAEGVWEDDAMFIDVDFWDKTAETVEKYVTKGSRILVDGVLKQESWEDKATGQKRSKFKVSAQTLVLLSGKQEKTGAGNSQEGEAQGDSEVPF